MPAGARELERLSVRIPEERCAPFRGIRYLQEDGTVLEARFTDGEGLGIRRTALEDALRERALACGAELRTERCCAARARGDRVELETSRPLETRRLADRRRRAALARSGAPRGWKRAHGDAPAAFRAAPPFRAAALDDLVEVHWEAGHRGVRHAGVAAIGERRLPPRPRPEARTSPRCSTAFPCSATASGTRRRSRRRAARDRCCSGCAAVWAERLALIGDAAGYVDAITGQGLSLAFAASALLMESLPDDLLGRSFPALRRYAARLRPRWLAYALPARALVALSGRPALRRVTFRSLPASRWRSELWSAPSPDFRQKWSRTCLCSSAMGNQRWPWILGAAAIAALVAFFALRRPAPEAPPKVAQTEPAPAKPPTRRFHRRRRATRRCARTWARSPRARSGRSGSPPPTCSTDSW